VPWVNVVKISKNSQTIDAVEVMHEHGVFSLPLLDADANLVGHISMSDFKYIILEDQNFSDLLIPLEEFVKKRLLNTQVQHHLITASVDATFREIVLILSKEHHVHQIYLVDSNNNPQSFVSMTDVCHKLFQNVDSPLVRKRAGSLGGFSRGNSLGPFSPRGSQFQGSQLLGTSL